MTVTDVHKAFGETRALQGCSFSARAGEVHAIVGENGSGKSTLAKLLSGIFAPDEGAARVFGAVPRNPRHATELGIATVFQEVLVAEGHPVLDNLFIGTDGFVRPSRSRQEKARLGAAELRRLTGETIDLHARVESLPLSQRQWVTIARALLRKPRVLVLDESTAALDLDGAKRLLRELRELKQAGVCVLLVTHRIGELTAYTDRATVLRDGRDVGTLEASELSEERLLKLMSGGSAVKQRTSEPSPVSAPRRPVLRARGVKLTDGTAPFDFELEGGEIVGLAGLDGHGQAQFLRAVAGIAPLAEGTVEVVGEDDVATVISGPHGAADCGVGYIPGDRKLEGIFPNLSILENFGMPLYRQNRRWGLIAFDEIRRRFRAQADALSVRLDSEGAPIGTLSGGNQQKVVIGRSLAQSPRIVALNDPTRGVDIGTKRDLYDVLRRLARQGRAVLFLSSEIEEFIGLCGRVAVFKDGTLFTTLPEPRVDFDTVLAAMFGRAER